MLKRKIEKVITKWIKTSQNALMILVSGKQAKPI